MPQRVGLTQDITYWSPPTLNMDTRRKTYGSPKTIKGRWEDKSVLVNDSDGQTFKADSIIYTYEELGGLGYLFLGESTANDPKEVKGAKEIQTVMFSPGIQKTVTKAIL